MDYFDMSAGEIIASIMIDLCITVVFYLLVPVILAIRGKKITEKQLRRIIIINSIVVWMIFAIIRIENGVEGTSGAVFLWGWVGYRILKKCCLKTECATYAEENDSAKMWLEKSFGSLNKNAQHKVFPNGKSEYVYVGTVLNTLFRDKDLIKLIQIYASVYTYYKLEMGNSAKSFMYARKKAGGVLTDDECKMLIGFVMLNSTSNHTTIADPVTRVYEYKEHVESYLSTVEGIQKNYSRFMTKPTAAGSMGNPILVAGICGVHKYVETLNIPGVERVKLNRTSSVCLTDEYSNISYEIDEYTLTDPSDGNTVATLWFNIYGTENTNVLPVCFAEKTSVPTTMDTDNREESFKEVVVCSKCKSEISAESKFCQYCGQKQVVQEKYVWYCRGCGNKLKDGYVFCNICGTKVIEK